MGKPANPDGPHLPGARQPAARLSACVFAASVLWLPSAAVAKERPNDFPTLARVQYVQECQTAHPGPAFEMRSKCSCAVDHLAGRVSHAQFETMKTATQALSIGGERGSTLRDNPQIRPWTARLKELEAQAAQACFLMPPK